MNTLNTYMNNIPTMMQAEADYAGYDDYNKITQNSAGDIILDCIDSKIHIYVCMIKY